MSQLRPKSEYRNPDAPLLIIISAPSGGGKTTLCQHLLERHPEMGRAVTCTTRQPRKGERDGVDYFFLDEPAFQRRVNAGDFLEHATVYGNSYGTPKSEVLARLRQGRDVLLNIDVQGAASVCASAEKDPALRHALVTVFLTPPSLEELATRLRRPGDRLRGGIEQTAWRGEAGNCSLADLPVPNCQHHRSRGRPPHGVHPCLGADARHACPGAGVAIGSQTIPAGWDGTMVSCQSCLARRGEMDVSIKIVK